MLMSGASPDISMYIDTKNSIGNNLGEHSIADTYQKSVSAHLNHN
jgi:hypothetical protein